RWWRWRWRPPRPARGRRGAGGCRGAGDTEDAGAEPVAAWAGRQERLRRHVRAGEGAGPAPAEDDLLQLVPRSAERLRHPGEQEYLWHRQGRQPPGVPDIAPGTSAEVVLQMAAGQNLSGTAPTNPLFLQVAIKNSLDIFYFNVPFDLSVALVESGAIGRDQFTGIWQRVGEAGQHTTTINVDRPINAETARSRLTPGNVHYVAQRQVDEQTVRMYLSAATTNNCAILAEVEVRSSATSVQIVTRTETPVLVPLFEAAVSKRLSGR
ncbi:unnamed protein product, partial [Prorocentrum cordatum]